MKSFNELTDSQQERAVEESLRRILRAITAGDLRFNDTANGNDMQAGIDDARRVTLGDADFQHLVLLMFHRQLTDLARETAANAVYREGETVIELDDL